MIYGILLIKYIIKKPSNKKNPWFLRYLKLSLYLYHAQIFDDEYIINRPNKDNIITAINKDLSIFFMASLRLVNCIIFTIKKDI